MFSIEIVSSPDRDQLVAEIWWNDQMVAELRDAQGGARFIDIYPSPSRIPWSFTLDDWLKVVEDATRRLGPHHGVPKS